MSFEWHHHPFELTTDSSEFVSIHILSALYLMKKTVLLPLLILLFASPALFAQNSVDPCENAPALIPDDRNDLEWWSNRHQEKLNEKGREDARLLFVGDSITQGWEGAGSELWKEYRSEEHTSELQSRGHLVCWLLLAKKQSNEVSKHM